MEEKTVKVVIALVLVLLVVMVTGGWMLGQSMNYIPVGSGGNTQTSIGFAVINEEAQKAAIGFELVNPNERGVLK